MHEYDKYIMFPGTILIPELGAPRLAETPARQEVLPEIVSIVAGMFGGRVVDIREKARVKRGDI